MKFTRTWFDCSEGILPEHTEIEIRQRYCFLFTADRHVVVVAKSDKKWQFPGGHPLEDESWRYTLVREVKEETGLEIESLLDNVVKLGYYLIEEEGGDTYLQERYFLILTNESDSLSLETDEVEDDLSKIEDVKAVPVSEIENYVPWAPEAEGWNKAVELFAETILMNMFSK